MTGKEEDLVQRLVDIRKYRGFSQRDCAAWLNISQPAWAKKERNKDAGFSLEDIRIILERTEIDARYLFGQVDSIEDADLRKNKAATYDLLVQKISDLEKRIVPAEEIDDLANKVMINQPLRSIVEMLKNVEGGKLKEIQGVVYGYLATGTTEESYQKGDSTEAIGG